MMKKDNRPLDFFRAASQSFLQAEASAKNLIERCYSVGRQKIRLRFAGSALVPLITPALEHLRIQSVSDYDLTICLWDSASTGVPMAAAPWTQKDFLARGEIRGFSNEQFRTTFHLGSGIFNMLDLVSGEALFWIRDYRFVPYYESGSPLRAIFSAWMSTQGYQFAHAAAVGTPEGGVLIVGRGGSGKSTAALACLDEEELIYVGDDYVLLGGDPEPYVYSLYNSAKLNADHAESFPHLLARANNKDKLNSQKALIFLNQHYPQKMSSGFPLRAIVAPQISGLSQTTFQKSSAAAAIKALAPSTIFQIPDSGSETFQFLSRIVKGVPSYKLHSGRKLSGIPSAVLALLAGSKHGH